MKTVLFHDTRILIKNRVLYSSGGVNKNIISRYLNLCEKFCLVTRENNLQKTENLSVIGDLDSISFYSIPNLAELNFYSYKTAYKSISEIMNKNDFMIIRLPSIIGLLAVYLAKKKKKKYLIELVGCALDSYRLHSFKGKFIAYPIYYITKYFVKNAKSVLYVTDNFLQKKYPTKTNQQIGCSDVELVIDKQVLNKRLKKIDLKSNLDIVRIGMIGFIEAKYKGFETALRALSLLKEKGNANFVLEIVGGGNPFYIKSLSDELGLQNHIKIIGPLSHPSPIFNWLDSIDLYLHPSNTEGMPRALIEAMSRGCACIGSNAGGIPELIDQEYLHKKNDFYRLAFLISELFNFQNMKKNSAISFKKASYFDKDILDVKRSNFYLKSMNK